MTMLSWAEKEIEIACKRERDKASIGDWDYGCACYESALKAFKSLCEDEHSGTSVRITKSILNRLIDGKTLSPIEDTDDSWNYVATEKQGVVLYQCVRMSSLFKYVYTDGTIKYSDVDRVCCVELNKPDNSYYSSFVTKLIDKMFPIAMPYYPKKAFVVTCEDFLTDKKNGDLDTMGIFYAVNPDGKQIEINRFFKDSPNDWDEIDREEYNQRKAVATHD